MLTISQAAAKADVSRDIVVKHIHSRALKASLNTHNQWVIRPSDLIEWMDVYAHRIVQDSDPEVDTSIRLTEKMQNSLSAAATELRITRIERAYAEKEAKRLADKVSSLEQEIMKNKKQKLGLVDTIQELSEVLAFDDTISTNNIFVEEEPLILPPDFKVTSGKDTQ